MCTLVTLIYNKYVDNCFSKRGANMDTGESSESVPTLVDHNPLSLHTSCAMTTESTSDLVVHNPLSLRTTCVMKTARMNLPTAGSRTCDGAQATGMEQGILVFNTSICH
jgi:hypothetical protein